MTDFLAGIRTLVNPDQLILALTPLFTSWVGYALFNDYALPFELISVLIMVAVFSGVLLAKKKL